MRGVILAAGAGRRLAESGWVKPKSLLQFGETTLLDNILDSLAENGIDEITVVVGYKQELIREVLERRNLDCHIIVNDDYASTNTINSLYLARNDLDRGFIYFNADILFDRRIVASLLEHADDSALAVDEKHCGAEEVKVIVDGGRRITRIGKQLESRECLGEFIGIGKFGQTVGGDMIGSLCRFNEELQERTLFFEAAVDAILPHHTLTAVSIGQLAAIEIDSPEDYANARLLWESGRIALNNAAARS